MRKTRQRAALLLLAGLVLGATPARAQYTLESTGISIDLTEASVVGAISTMFTWLQNTLFNQTQSAIAANTAANATSQQVTVEAMTRISDVGLAQQWGMAQAQAQAAAQAETHPSVAACQPASGSRAIVTNELPDSMNLSLMLDAGMRRRNNAPGENTQNGTFAGVSLDYQYRMANYGDCNETQPGNASCVSGAMPNADVNAMTLFGQDTFRQSAPVGQTTPAYTAQQWQTAAEDFCLNATDSVDPNPLRNDALISPEGITAHMLRKAADSRMALSQMVCFEDVAERVGNQAVTCPSGGGAAPVGGPCWGQQIMSDLVKAYPNDTTIANEAQGPFSTHQLLKILGSEQFADPNWDQMVNSEQGESQLLQTLNRLQSASIQMQWKEYEMLERLKLLDAVSLAMSVEKSRGPTPAPQ